MHQNAGNTSPDGAHRSHRLLALLVVAAATMLLACGSSEDNLNGLAITPATIQATAEPSFNTSIVVPVEPGDGRADVPPAATPLAEVVTVPTTATITTDNLNVRTGPGLGYSVLRQLQPGDQIPLAGVSLDGEWVASPDVGWVFYNPQWMSLDGEFALLGFAEGFEAPEPPPAAAAPAPGTGESVSVKLGPEAEPVEPPPVEEQVASVMRGLIVTDNLNVRAGPGLIHAVLDKLQLGDKILVAGVSQDRAWVAATGLGWIFYRSDWIDLDGDLDDLAVATDFEAPAG